MLVFVEVTKSLEHQPDVKVADRVIYMEVIWNVQGVDKLPAVNVLENPSHDI